LFERGACAEGLDVRDGIEDVFDPALPVLLDHGLGQDPVADARLQALRRAKVDPTSKQILEVALELHESEQPDGSVELDQLVHVAVLSRFVARDRAKESEMRHAEFRVQLGPLGSQR
jgi:hypothetical protein